MEFIVLLAVALCLSFYGYCKRGSHINFLKNVSRLCNPNLLKEQVWMVFGQASELNIRKEGQTFNSEEDYEDVRNMLKLFQRYMAARIEDFSEHSECKLISRYELSDKDYLFWYLHMFLISENQDFRGRPAYDEEDFYGGKSKPSEFGVIYDKLMYLSTVYIEKNPKKFEKMPCVFLISTYGEE